MSHINPLKYGSAGLQLQSIVSHSSVGLFVLEFYPRKITFIHSRQFTVVNIENEYIFWLFLLSASRKYTNMLMEAKFVWFRGVDTKYLTCSHLLVKWMAYSYCRWWITVLCRRMPGCSPWRCLPLRAPLFFPWWRPVNGLLVLKLNRPTHIKRRKKKKCEIC